ncbi:hypothetical protein KVT40_005201 [Elsinoe batatas]|uniref:DNA mismatch repair protein MSH5 n=1 Tax=Elsinoe batatas TaxID=2601811 RepID=A0A8K0L237_9PEZI|nr:hypothetical protein KVT40_005201 [Elsinoe batatas]
MMPANSSQTSSRSTQRRYRGRQAKGRGQHSSDSTHRHHALQSSSSPANRSSQVIEKSPPHLASSQQATPASSATSAAFLPGYIPPRGLRDDQDLDDDSLQEIVMAINVKERGSVGCAYYVARDEKLYCMEDVKQGGPEIVDALKSFVSPTSIIVPFNLDESVLDLIDIQRNNVDGDGNHSEPPGLPYTVDFRVSGDFKYEAARDKLVNLRIGHRHGPRVTLMVPGDIAATDEPDDFGEETANRVNNLLSLGCSVNVESHLSIGCAGAILNHIDRRRNAAFVPGDTAAFSFFRISSVAMFSLGGFMFVNSDTLASLQVIQSEAHPSAQNHGMANSGSKEGLSVYGLFHHFARTTQGRAILRQYFLRPSVNIDVINHRLDAISTFIRPDNQPLMDRMVSHLKAVKNMHTVLLQVRKGNSTNIMPGRSTGVHRTVWSNIREFLYRALEIRQAFEEISGAHRLAIFGKVMRNFDGRTMSVIGNTIGNTIDFELSIEQHRSVVKAGVDFELDEIKRTYAGMDDLLSHVATAMARTISPIYNAQLNVIFFPQIGFLISVRRIPDTTRGVYAGEEDAPWDQQFYTGDYVYYKDARTRAMDEEYGDVYGSICDREIEIIQRLGEQVLQHEEQLCNVSDICGELDCLLALAQGAREYNLCRPHLMDENVLRIKAGRHILQERTVPTFIANDTSLVGGAGQDAAAEDDVDNVIEPTTPSIMLITGPNYSGKSVYLKQVALITLMAHIGSFVPAESAVIGLTDKILTRIWTRESVSRAQSAFMIDLQQMSLGLSLATRRSLVVIDEFGKGTDSHDGAGLAAGVFTYLLSLGSERPRIVAATHFHEIFHGALLSPHPSLAFHQMRILLSQNVAAAQRPQPTNTSSAASSIASSLSSEDITYLYALELGRTSSSYGTICARMNGVPSHVVRYADDLVSASERGEDLVALCAKMGDQEKDELREAEDIARRFLLDEIESREGDQEGDVIGAENEERMRAWLGTVLGEVVVVS